VRKPERSVERLAAENAELREEVQRLRDENNRLKGEQGKPDVKPSTRGRDIDLPDHSMAPFASQGGSCMNNGAGVLDPVTEASRRCADLPRSSTSIALEFGEDARHLTWGGARI
jgi:hypothetical protein